jgi:acetyl-CoA carboxylase biotin carboxyl carrier protein
MSKATNVIDTALIRELAQVLNDTNLTEIEVEHETLRIRVAREIQVQAYAPVQMSAPAAQHAPKAATPVVVATPAAADHPGLVTSPMVGTAYRRPSPDAANLVELGQVVKAGDKLLLIEAMKTFNDIVAPRAGTVTQIIFTDGRPVEFGEPLLIIE